MKTIKFFVFSTIFAFFMLVPEKADARCVDSNRIINGNLWLYTDCYFLGIRYRHTATNWRPIVI